MMSARVSSDDASAYCCASCKAASASMSSPARIRRCANATSSAALVPGCASRRPAIALASSSSASCRLRRVAVGEENNDLARAMRHRQGSSKMPGINASQYDRQRRKARRSSTVLPSSRWIVARRRRPLVNVTRRTVRWSVERTSRASGIRARKGGTESEPGPSARPASPMSRSASSYRDSVLAAKAHVNASKCTSTLGACISGCTLATRCDAAKMPRYRLARRR
mmetsp:Transcript_12244/g.38805  ORF Transcript_12244/g.38805 Transcript_12244/m.38805 type:complete len:225 (-) Transcript_12244:336-1010(-)